MSGRTIRVTLVSAMIIGVVALAALVFWTMDFHASQSQTDAQYTLSTSTVSTPDVTILVEGGIVIQPVETGVELMDRALSQELIERLRQHLPLDQIVVSGEGSKRAVLLVEINESDLHWTPIRSSADLTVEVIYASDGDLSWRYDTGMVMDGTQPIVHSRGTLHLTDHTQGIISRKAYQKHLGTQLAAEIYRMMQQPLFDPPGS